MSVEKHVTTGLDALALLMLAAGVLTGLWPLIAGWSIACGGAVVYLGVRFSEGDFHAVISRLAARRERRKT